MIVCNLSSGSKGNSTYIDTGNLKILIDIGNSCAYIERALSKINVNASDIDLILITHAHIDHINGLKVFNKKYHPLIYITDDIINEANLCEVEFKRISSLDEFKNLKINSINLSHDVTDIKGYIIEKDASSMVYITDTGYINSKYFTKLKNKSLYIFESNHDVEMLMNNSRYPHHTKIRILSDKGHLSNKDSAYYMSKFIGNNTKHVVLAHLSEQNNTEYLALTTLKEQLESKDIYFDNIDIARQNEISKVYNI